ncbi:MAG: CARDB domain-containing protein [Bacteroidota bacterium]
MRRSFFASPPRLASVASSMMLTCLWILFTACPAPEPIPCTNIADPDLKNNFVPLSPTSIPAGDTFETKNRTDNVNDPSSCQTLTAAASEIYLIVEYRLDQFEPYDTVRTVFKNINSIGGGLFAENDYEYLFAQPGQYRITNVSDGKNEISERDETNNAYSDAAIGTNKKADPLEDVTVTVTPNPDFEPAKAGFEPGEYVKIRELK